MVDIEQGQGVVALGCAVQTAEVGPKASVAVKTVVEIVLDTGGHIEHMTDLSDRLGRENIGEFMLGALPQA